MVNVHIYCAHREAEPIAGFRRLEMAFDFVCWPPAARSPPGSLTSLFGLRRPRLWGRLLVNEDSPTKGGEEMGKRYYQSRKADANQLEFALEYSGIYEVNRQGGTCEIQRTHGCIANQLAEELKRRGFHVNNKPLRSGLIPDIVATKDRSTLVEIKSGNRSLDITAAIGQLFAYSQLMSGGKIMPMVAVVPEKTSMAKQELLMALGIDVVLWGEHDDEMRFWGLNEAFGAPQD